MQSPTVNIQLTREQAEQLASLLSTLNGRLQYRAANTPDGSLDATWGYWQTINKGLMTALGYEALLLPSKEIDQLIG